MQVTERVRMPYSSKVAAWALLLIAPGACRTTPQLSNHL